MELFISSTISTNEREIVQALLDNGVESQVYKNASAYNGRVEDGYKIVLFDITEQNFKNKVWKVLKRRVPLECAFVKSEYYHGCVSNWPMVFSKSKCPSQALRKKKRKRSAI